MAVTKPSAKKTVDIEKGRLREFRPSDKTLFPQRITGNKREISKKPLLFKTLKKKARYDEDLEGPYLLKAHGFWPGHGGPFHMPGREFLKAYNYDEGDQSVLEKRFLTALRATFGKKALEKFNIIKDRSTDASLIAQLVVSAARSSSKSKRALSGSAKLAGWYKQGRQALLADSDSEASEEESESTFQGFSEDEAENEEGEEQVGEEEAEQDAGLGRVNGEEACTSATDANDDSASDALSDVNEENDADMDWDAMLVEDLEEVLDRFSQLQNTAGELVRANGNEWIEASASLLQNSTQARRALRDRRLRELHESVITGQQLQTMYQQLRQLHLDKQ